MYTFFEYTNKDGEIVEVYTGFTSLAWKMSSPLVQDAELRAVAEQEGVQPEDLFVAYRRTQK